MIRKLTIKNFQSHEDTALELDPGLNVIVGASDSGKSAVIRALRWLVWNRPMGTAFRSHWGGNTSVSAQINDGQTVVTRARTDKENVYRINNQKLEAVKNDVPEEIQAALNMDETNLQQQLDRPFLISNTPGEVATYFNKVARLDKIDTGIKQINGEVKRLSSEIKSDETRLATFTEELKGFDYLAKYEVDLESLEKLVQQRKGAIAAKEDIEYALDMLESYDASGEKMAKKQKFLTPVNALLEKHRRWDELQKQIQKLEREIAGIKRIEATTTAKRSELVDMEQYYHENMPDECPLCGTVSESK